MTRRSGKEGEKESREANELVPCGRANQKKYCQVNSIGGV